MDEVRAYYRRRYLARYVRSRFQPRSRGWRRDLARGIRSESLLSAWRRLPVFERHVLVSASGRAFDDTVRKFGAGATVRGLGFACDHPIAREGGNLILTARIGMLGAIGAILVEQGHNVAFSSAHPEHGRRSVLPKLKNNQRGVVAPLAFPSWEALLSVRRGLGNGWDFVLPIDSTGEPGTASFRAEYARVPDRMERAVRVIGKEATLINFMCVEVVNGWKPKLNIIFHRHSGDSRKFFEEVEKSLLRLPHQWHVWTAIGAVADRTHTDREVADFVD